MSTERVVTSAETKAAILSEALPYIKRFSGACIVIKYGGSAMDDPALAASFAQDVVLMRLVGMNPIVVHGGGPQISEQMRKFGKEPVFVDGHRVTDAETADIVRMTLVGKVNREIVSAINRNGPYAVGLSGEDAGLISVTQRDARLGFVGDVDVVNPSILMRLIREELIPVVATVTVDSEGQAYNINADAVAGKVASAIGAQKLVYLTNVPGLLRDLSDDASLISEISTDELAAMLDRGELVEGMIPKISSCVSAVRAGVPRAHIIDGRVPHSLLLEFFTSEGIGTMITNASADAASIADVASVEGAFPDGLLGSSA